MDSVSVGHLIAFAGAVITAVLGYFGGRAKFHAEARAIDRKSSAEAEAMVQAAIATATERIIAHYTRALQEAAAEIKALREEVADLKLTIATLEQHVDALTDELKAAGRNPPPRRRPQEMTS